MAGKKTGRAKSGRLKRKNSVRVRIRKRRQKKRLLLMEGIIVLFLLFALLTEGGIPGKIFQDIWNSTQGNYGQGVKTDASGLDEQTKGTKELSDNERTGTLEGQLVVTYLDVGQADCTILQIGEHAMMIDGGGRGTKDDVAAAVKSLGITQFDYIVATHSHEDHIGGLGAVLDAFPVQTILLLREDNDSKIYQEFLEGVKRSGAAVMEPEPGLSFLFGDAKVQILAPKDKVFDDANNCSICLMVTFGERKFLFTGDAEEESERQMLGTGLSLEADVFQAGHHGSQTSNSEAFLLAVDPVYTVISCGEGNSYGHPHSEVIARFEEMDVQIYRTDTMGTITIKTDGNTLEIATEGK